MIDCKSYIEKHKKIIKEKSNSEFLVIIQVGNNEASNRYIKHKIADCEEVGISTKLYKFDEDIIQEELENQVKIIISQNNITGIMVQLPLPKNINTDSILRLIPSELDVDGLNPNSLFTPCTAKGTMLLLDDLKYNLCGKVVVVLGKSKIVGKPLINLLLEKQATVISLNSSTSEDNFNKFINIADVLISAVGKINLININNLKNNNVLIIDIGINFDNKGKLVGDCDKKLYDKVENITPVPNGMGLYTRISLLYNLIEKNNKISG